MLIELGKKYLSLLTSMLVVAAFAFSCLGSATAGDSTCPNAALRKILVDVAYRADFDRWKHAEEQDAWLTYKNGPNSKPVTVDLSDMCLAAECPLLQRDHPTPPKSVIANPTRYESAVLALRKGDKVVFDGVTYTLGRFLGAGNATHIFALKGTKDAIRLPFLSDFMWDQPCCAAALTQEQRLGLIRSYTISTQSRLMQSQGAVKIIKTDLDGRFMIVQRVNGTLTAKKFLERLTVDPRFSVSPNAPVLYPSRRQIKIESQMTALEKEQYVGLVEIMKKNKDTNTQSETGILTIDEVGARQYVWDTRERRWYLVDGQ